MKKYNIGILGATGAVGREMLKVLEERSFPVGEIRLLASERSVGKLVKFKGEDIAIKLADFGAFEGLDFVLGAASNADDGTVKVAGKDLEGLNLLCVLLQNLCRSNCVIFADRDSGHTVEVLLHVAVANCLTSAAGHGVLDNHILHACFTQSLTQSGVVLNRDALVVHENAGNGVLDLLCQFSHSLLLLLENHFAGHFFFTSRNVMDIKKSFFPPKTPRHEERHT